MMKKNLHNQSGFSLVMAIVAFSVVASGTFYLMEIIGANRRNAIKSKTVTSFEAERKRITTILGDSANCTKNFAGQLSGTATFTNLYYNSSPLTNPFLSTGFQTSTKLNLISMQITFIPASPNSGALTLTYNNTGGYKGKNLIQMTIPFYQLSDGANKITTCYAITENQKVGVAIEAACQSTTTDSYSNFNKTNGVTNTCSTNFTLAANSTTPAAITDCTTSPSGASSALRGFDVTTVLTSPVDTGRTVYIPLTKCASFTNPSSSCTDPYARLWKVDSNGVLTCDVPGNTAHDTTICAGGQLIYKTSSSAATCVSPSCAGNSFMTGFTNAGASCASANPVPCPAGSYASSFSSAGTATCSPFPVINKTCPGTDFAIAFVRNDATNSGTITCSAYTKTKTCPANTSLSYLDGAGNPVCTAY